MNRLSHAARTLTLGILLFAICFRASAQTYGYGRSFYTIDPGELNAPKGVAIDSTGIVYVTLPAALQEFDQNGNIVRTLTHGGPLQGFDPLNVRIDGNDNAYVSGGNIQEFDAHGNFVRAFGSGTNTWGICLSGSDFYVSEWANNRIVEFDGNGTVLRTFGSPGAGSGQFSTPTDIALDQSGNIYVADYGNSRIDEFSSDGSFARIFAGPGTGPGQVTNPEGIAFDKAGNLFVADTNGHRVEELDPAGNFVQFIGSAGTGLGQFELPSDLAFDGAGNLYVSDFYNGNVSEFFVGGPSSVPEPAPIMIIVAFGLFSGSVWLRSRKSKANDSFHRLLPQVY